MGNYSKHDKIPIAIFLETLSENIDDGRLSDKMFRDLIRNLLPITELKEREDGLDSK